MRYIGALAVLILVGLTGCNQEPPQVSTPTPKPVPTQQTTTGAAPSSAVNRAGFAGVQNCTVQVVQDGARISPVVGGESGPPSYRLKPSPFRLEVSSPTCKPGFALVTRESVKVISATPRVFTGAGYWMAGALTTAMTLTEAAVARNPRTSLEEEIAMQTPDAAWGRLAYQDACTLLNYCPQPIKAYRSTWSFLDPKTRSDRGYAEFTLFDRLQPMAAAAGREFHAVVYMVETVYLKNKEPQFFILKPHILQLSFDRQ